MAECLNFCSEGVSFFYSLCSVGYFFLPASSDQKLDPMQKRRRKLNGTRDGATPTCGTQAEEELRSTERSPKYMYMMHRYRYMRIDAPLKIINLTFKKSET